MLGRIKIAAEVITRVIASQKDFSTVSMFNDREGSIPAITQYPGQ